MVEKIKELSRYAGQCVNSERGVTAIEYAIIAAAVVVVGMVTVPTVGPLIATQWTAIAAAL